MSSTKTIGGYILVTLIGMFCFHVRLHFPEDLHQHWKARQITHALHACDFMASLSERFQISNRTNALRSMIEKMTGLIAKNYTGLQVNDTDFDGIKVRLYAPQNRSIQKPRPVVFFYHGGGWTLGSVESYDHVAAAFARNLQMLVVSVGYRLAPEHTFPAQRDDCLNAVIYLYKNYRKYEVDPYRFAIIGAEAGGNMAVSVGYKLSSMWYTGVPKLQILAYPLLQAFDLSLSSYLLNNYDFYEDKEHLVTAILSYMGKPMKLKPYIMTNNHISEKTRRKYSSYFYPEQMKPPHVYPSLLADIQSNTAHVQLAKDIEKYILDPYFMPLMAHRLRYQPKTFIITCEHDPLRDDGILFKEKLEYAGINVTHHNFANSYPAMLLYSDGPLKTDEGAQMIQEITTYIANNL